MLGLGTQRATAHEREIARDNGADQGWVCPILVRDRSSQEEALGSRCGSALRKSAAFRSSSGSLALYKRTISGLKYGTPRGLRPPRRSTWSRIEGSLRNVQSCPAVCSSKNSTVDGSVANSSGEIASAAFCRRAQNANREVQFVAPVATILGPHE